MADLQNVVTADGATWSGAAPSTNTISALGAMWMGGGAGLSGFGTLALDGSATVAAAVAGTAGGVLPIGGSGRIAEGRLEPSARRGALPSGSRNGGHLVPRH